MRKRSKVRQGKGAVANPEKPRIKPLPPTSDAARDEGPRLLPLGPVRERTGLEHYLALADVALGQRKKS
jgi:hypothetical protein